MGSDVTTNPVKTTCGICQVGCGVLAYLSGGRVVKIEGDPDHPLNKGVLCSKGEASIEYLYHPDRLKVPLKRVGERGEGKWKPINWEEALGIISDRLLEIKARYGPESVVFMRGAAKGLQDEYLARFANLFGSPNFLSMGYVCFIPRRNASVVTYGCFHHPDFDYPPATIIVWGENISDTLHHVYRRIMEAVKKGSRLIVIDPVKTEVARQAHLWIRPRPGTDLALALGMLHVIVGESLYDRPFIDRCTVGFEDLKSHLPVYTPERVEEITWVPSETVREAARLFSREKPGVIQWGNGIDQTPDNFQAARAMCILRAVTGNVGIPGGDIPWLEPPILARGSSVFSLHEKIPPEVREKRLKGKEKLLPNVFYALQQEALEAMITGRPYPVRAGYVQGANPLLTYPHAQKTREAFERLDFFAVADMFMTPTAALADVVLPSATYLEFDSIVAAPYSLPVVSVQQAVTRIPECRSDYAILKGLADQMGYGEDFWGSEEESLDFVLRPAGLTFQEFRNVGVLQGMKEYRAYERTGFGTPSGKVELYSERLKAWGFDPLPTYRERHEDRTDVNESYPLILTSWKRAPFRHSGGRQIGSLRRLHPDPVVLVHPATARVWGVEEGDWVSIETPSGKICQKVALSADLDPRVVCADVAWWRPEAGSATLYGWSESNVNILTDDRSPSGREMGTPRLRGLPCRIRAENRQNHR